MLMTTGVLYNKIKCLWNCYFCEYILKLIYEVIVSRERSPMPELCLGMDSKERRIYGTGTVVRLPKLQVTWFKGKTRKLIIQEALCELGFSICDYLC